MTKPATSKAMMTSAPNSSLRGDSWNLFRLDPMESVWAYYYFLEDWLI